MGNEFSGVNAPLGSINVSLNPYRPSNYRHNRASSIDNKSLSDERIDLEEFLEGRNDLEYKTGEISNINPDEIKIEKSWLEKLAGSRFAKHATSALNFNLALNDGAIVLTEKIADGAIWSVKAIGNLYVKLGSKVVSLFDPEFSKKMDAANDLSQDFYKNVISFSVIDWWRNLLSDNDIMREINKNTFIEYGGEKSKKISDVSEKIQTFVGAALSSKVWGGCLALLLGGCYGSGAQAEKLYSTRDETGVREELSILFSGGKEAMKWFTIAKVTKTITSVFQGGGATGMNGNFVNNAKEFGKQTFKNFRQTNLEVFKAFKTEGVKGLLNPFTKYLGEFFCDPYYSGKVFAGLTRNFDDYFSGDKEFTIGSLFNDIIYSTSIALSGSMRLNLGDNGGTYSVPQFGLTFLNPIITDYINKLLGIEDVGSSENIEDIEDIEDIEEDNLHHGGGGGSF